MARQLKRTFKNFWGDQLISEEKEDTLLAALNKRPALAAIPWGRLPHGWILPTPYGTLKISVHVGHCRLVERDGSELIHSSTGRPVIFRSVAAAKLAAIYSLQNGFGKWPALDEGWHWDVKCAVDPAAPCMHLDPMPATFPDALPDIYEVGRDKLNDHLRDVFATSLAADENLLLDIHAQERIWKLRVPDWSMVGHHHLRTPYGVLRVQRFLRGWTVHRQASSLVWYISEKLVIFWSLQDAKLAALVHMNDNSGSGPFLDGTKWASDP